MGDPGIIPPLKIGGLSMQPPTPIGGPAWAAMNRAHTPGKPMRGIGQPGNAGPLQDILNLNQFDLHGRIWQQYQCDRPTILYPIVSSVNAVLGGQVLAGSQRPIYYMPNVQTDRALASMAVPEEALLSCQVSRGCGVVYLSHAGRWSLYYDAANNASNVRMLAIDASDPAVAARYLFEEGIHGFTTNASVLVTTSDVLLLSSNRLRKGFMLSIADSTVTNPIRLGFNAAAVAAAAPTGSFKLGSANEPTSFSMSGENCFKGEIRATRDTTAVADVTVTTLEWF